MTCTSRRLKSGFNQKSLYRIFDFQFLWLLLPHYHANLKEKQRLFKKHPQVLRNGVCVQSDDEDERHRAGGGMDDEEDDDDVELEEEEIERRRMMLRQRALQNR